MNSFIDTGSFLQTSRDFPKEIDGLTSEINRSYVQIARNVNIRTVGFFTINRSTVTGENWLITQNKRQQGYRQVYQFKDSDFVAGVATIAHGISFFSLTNFVRIWGTFFESNIAPPAWYNLPYVDVLAVTNQMNVKVTATDIIITKGATFPFVIENGLVTVEFIANP